MMKRKSAVFSAALIAVGLMVSGCKTNAEDIDKGPHGTKDPLSNVSFDDHRTYSVRVKNETDVDLVAFKGKIAKDTLIGGVKAHSEAGLKRNEQLFNATGDFALLFLTTEQYSANQNNLTKVQNQAFTACYAFYNKNGQNETVYRISSSLGGDAKLVLRNNTKYNIELRQNSPDGEVLGYVGANTASTVLNVASGTEMTIFPVFRRYSHKKNEMYTINPTTPEGDPLATQRSVEKGENILRIGDLWNAASISNFTTGGCYVTFTNKVKTTGVVLMRNGAEVLTSTGVKTVNPGKDETFFLPFPKVGNKDFPDKMKIKLGVSTFAGKQFDAAEYEFKKDHAYKFEVTGNSYSLLIPSAVQPLTTEDKPIDVQAALFGND